MELSEPGLDTYLRALRNALHRIDSFWELPDHIKDQRKFEIFADLIGEVCGYHDDELIRQMGKIMVADGLEPMMVMLVSDGAIERARLAVEHRETMAAPKRLPPGGKRPRKPQLPRSTKDALDFLLMRPPLEMEAFLEVHTGDELDLILAYLEERKNGR